jgi:small GTP-binding protein
VFRFGIGPLDERLERAGEPSGHALLAASPGLDPMPFALHAAVTSVAGGLPCAIVVNNKPPRAVEAAARHLGYNLEGDMLRGRLTIVDAFSAAMGVPPAGGPVVNEPTNPAEVREAIDGAAGPDALVVFDSISSWLDLSGEGARGVGKLLEAVGAGRPLFGLFSLWGYAPQVVDSVRAHFDHVVALQPVEGVAVVRQFLVAQRIAGKEAQPLALPVKTLAPGGVHVYIPKVLVTGPQGAGKTALIGALSSTGASAEALGTTVALDHGTLGHGGITAELYGTPGAEAFDPLLPTIAEESVAVILVVDSGAPDTFARARAMLKRAAAEGLPTVVAANKTDRRGALSPAEVKKRLDLPENVPVVGTDASIGEGLDDLLEEVTRKLLREAPLLVGKGGGAE